MTWTLPYTSRSFDLKAWRPLYKILGEKNMRIYVYSWEREMDSQNYKLLQNHKEYERKKSLSNSILKEHEGGASWRFKHAEPHLWNEDPSLTVNPNTKYISTCFASLHITIFKLCFMNNPHISISFAPNHRNNLFQFLDHKHCTSSLIYFSIPHNSLWKHSYYCHLFCMVPR